MLENIFVIILNFVDYVGNYLVDFILYFLNIMNVLKNFGMFKNVKLEFYLL